ncbi:MAG: PIG-L family deacetylase [Anaerolineae bacterium]
MNVLVIAAHPDDEVLGCGGTIARLSQEGHSVYIAILGEGLTSRYPQRDQASSDLLETLHARSHQVANLLGAKELLMYNLADNRFDTVPLLDIVKIVEELIEKLMPHSIYTQHGGDLNVDHTQVYRATLTATRPMAGRPVKAVYAYEVASSTEWAFQKFSPVFQPNVFVDINNTLSLKIQAMQLYESEARLFPHPRSPQALQAIAQRWGSVVGLQAAEAFELIREIR